MLYCRTTSRHTEPNSDLNIENRDRVVAIATKLVVTMKNRSLY